MDSVFGVTDGEGIGKAITTRAGSRMDDNFIFNNKRLNKTLASHKDKLEENSFIDSYNKQVNNTGISGTITTRVSDSNCTHIINNLRIRKLTPKECWRLMGFDDSDFDKAAQVNSNSQLYKQAGNSIVVNVLEEIFKNLFKEE